MASLHPSRKMVAPSRAPRDDGAMLNIVSLVIGVVALILTLIAFLPLLGWANWFILPLAVIALVLGLFSSKKSGQTLAIVVIAIGVIRLLIGGGLF